MGARFQAGVELVAQTDVENARDYRVDTGCSAPASPRCFQIDPVRRHQLETLLLLYLGVMHICKAGSPLIVTANLALAVANNYPLRKA